MKTKITALAIAIIIALSIGCKDGKIINLTNLIWKKLIVEFTEIDRQNNVGGIVHTDFSGLGLEWRIG